MSDPKITWIGSPHHFNGRSGYQPTALVLHTMGGSLVGTDAWFSNQASQVSAHYGIGLSGEAHQYVHLADGAWANGVLEAGNHWQGPPNVNPNLLTVSIETEDMGNAGQPVTKQQYAATLGVARLACDAYPSITRLLSHAVISPKTRPNCCGSRWIASGMFQQLADDLGLTALPK